MAEIKTKSIEELLALISDEINEARGVPFRGDMCMIERDHILDLLDEVRNNLPNDLKQAKSIVEARDKIVSNAKAEAEQMLHTASERAKSLVESDEVVVSAKKQAREIVLKAEQRVGELQRTTGAYVDDSLKKTEESIAAMLTEVKKMRQQIKTITGSVK